MLKYIFIISVIGLLFLSSCKDQSANTEDIVFPDTGKVSYIQSVQPLFDRTCNFSGCHDDATTAQRGFSLTDYNNFMTGAATQIVFRGDPDASPLIRRLEGLPPGTPMPPDRPPLNTNQKNGMRRWVLQGARAD
jgi:hypothetical protein